MSDQTPLVCPYRIERWEWDEDGGEFGKTCLEVCGEELYLRHELYVPLVRSHLVERDTSQRHEPRLDDLYGPEQAETKHWSVRCTVGHVLAQSVDEDGSGDVLQFHWRLLPDGFFTGRVPL